MRCKQQIVRPFRKVYQILVFFLAPFVVTIGFTSCSLAFDSHEEKAAAVANLLTQYATRFHCKDDCVTLSFDHGSPVAVSFHVDNYLYADLMAEVGAKLGKYNLTYVFEYSNQDGIAELKVHNRNLVSERDEIKLNCNVKYFYTSNRVPGDVANRQSEIEFYTKRILACVLPRVGFPEYSAAIRGLNNFLFDIYVAGRSKFEVSGVSVDEFNKEMLRSVGSQP